MDADSDLFAHILRDSYEEASGENGDDYSKDEGRSVGCCAS